MSNPFQAADPRLSRLGVRRALRAATRRLLAATCLSFAFAAQAQSESPRLTAEELAALPLVSVHVTSIAPDAPGEVTILLPRPAGLVSADHLALLLDECLVPTGGTAEAGPEEPLGLVVHLRGADRCATTAVLAFDTADGQVLAAGAVVVSRARAPALPDGLVLATLGVDRIGVPAAAAGADPLGTASVLHLTLTNLGEERLVVDRLLEEDALAELAGALFTPGPGAYDGTWSSLLAGAQGFAAADLAPGEKVEYLLVIDPSRRLATGSWAVTVRPAFEVLLAGERHSLVLDQASIVVTPPPTP